ncbi:MAG: SRPBCC family protein [Gemmatimonadota bacterium]|nr:SRPBCC family protein [Gemmatimonadota bacterium]
MARNVRRMQCGPESVFEVIGEGWLYPAWVVGASRMREVDSSWPQPGSRLHHSVGVWPALIDDSTSCTEWDPPRRAVLTARGWPLGEARVTIDVKPHDDGCLVRIQEEAVSGPALLARPIVDLLLLWRNAETLHRLAYLAEGIGPRSDITAHEEDPETAP